MKPFRWSPEKNELLRAERSLTFERVVVAIESGGLLDVVEHPNQTKYPRQKIMVVSIDNYAYLVPFVEENDHYFLKTAIPSRKASRDFLQKGQPDVSP
jgi:acyl-CoA thioesterase